MRTSCIGDGAGANFLAILTYHVGRQSGFKTREALREKDAGAGSWELGTVMERARFRELRISMSETPSTLPLARLCFLQQISLNHMFHSFFFSFLSLLIGAQFQHQISTQFPVRRVFQQESEEADTSHSVDEIPQRLPQASPWALFLPSLSMCSKKAGSF